MKPHTEATLHCSAWRRDAHWIRAEPERLAALWDRWPHISDYEAGGSPATVLP